MQNIGSIQPQQPYNFALTAALIERFPHPTVDLVRQGVYWRLLREDESQVLVSVQAGENDALRVDCAYASAAFSSEGILKQIRHLLCTDLDLRPFYDYARNSPALWHIIEPLLGLRWLRTESVYEALMTTIIEQQIAWKSAQKAQRWLVEWGGHFVDHEGERFYAFPLPEQIAAASVEDLQPLKITFRRMQVMIALSQAVASGSLNLEQILNMPQDEGYHLLTSLKGVGHWTAAWTLQRAHGINQRVGHNDVALQAAVNHYFYGGSGRIPAEQVLATFDTFGHYAGLAAHHTILRWILDRY